MPTKKYHDVNHEEIKGKYKNNNKVKSTTCYIIIIIHIFAAFTSCALYTSTHTTDSFQCYVDMYFILKKKSPHEDGNVAIKYSEGNVPKLTTVLLIYFQALWFFDTNTE